LEAKNKFDLMAWVENIENILGVREEGVSMQDFELMTVVGRGSYGKVCHMHSPVPFFLLQCTYNDACRRANWQVVVCKKLDTGKIVSAPATSFIHGLDETASKVRV
jgi:hypothetical protein